MANRTLATTVAVLLLGVMLAPPAPSQETKTSETKTSETKTSETKTSETKKADTKADVKQDKAKPTKKKLVKKWSSTKVNDLTFDDLAFDIEKDAEFDRDMLTESIEGLDDKKVRLRGWILPSSTFRLKGIRRFVLVRDNMECCFGPGALIYDCVMVEMVKGKSAEFTTRPVVLEGEFSVKEYEYPDGGHYAIYRIKGVSVK